MTISRHSANTGVKGIAFFMTTKMFLGGLLRSAKSTQALFGAVCVIILGVGCASTFGSTTTGLDFPGSNGTTVRYRFTNPLPIYPATYIWRAYPREQPPDWPTLPGLFYTTFFWGNDPGYTVPTGDTSVFLWDGGSANTYYGAHPYPEPQPPNFNFYTEKWEIASDGYDFTGDPVQFRRWYNQALVAWADADGFKHTVFYWDLSDPSKAVTHVSAQSYGNVNPPSPALTFGDAPWSPGREVYNGILSGIRVYSTNLSLSNILSEASAPLSTAAGKANIWYLNMNPTPDDISDKSGKSHNPSWIGTARPTLYTETSPINTPVGSPTVLLTDPANGTKINLKFSNVTQAGLTELTAAAGPPLPANFFLVKGYYNLTTTAAFTGSVTVCIDVGVNPTTAQTVGHRPDGDDRDRHRDGHGPDGDDRDRHRDGHGPDGDDRDRHRDGHQPHGDDRDRHRDGHGPDDEEGDRDHDDRGFVDLQLIHYVNGVLDQSFESFTLDNSICGQVTSLSPFAVVRSGYHATVEPPISAAGTSVFNDRRGVVPVKFRLSLNGESTCRLPAATIAVFRLGGTAPVPVNQSDFLAPPDSGSTFRIDGSNCQYMYHLNSRSLESGSYSTQIRIGG